jgi:acyl carrier protein
MSIATTVEVLRAWRAIEADSAPWSRRDHMADVRANMMAGAAPATDLDGIRRQIHEFVATNFLFDGSLEQLDDSESLIESGVVDDTGVLELVLFLEEAWGLTVNQGDLAPENLESVDALATYVFGHLHSR